MEIWLLLGIIFLLFGTIVWLDFRVQKLEDAMWDHLLRQLEDRIAADRDADAG